MKLSLSRNGWKNAGVIGQYCSWDKLPGELTTLIKKENKFSTQHGDYIYNVVFSKEYLVFRYTLIEWASRPASQNDILQSMR
jgi:hypothetical protein